MESLKNAINLIKSRIGNLQKVEGEEAKKEVTELSALIPEIEEKIKDTEVRFCLISTSFGNASSHHRTSRRNPRRKPLLVTQPGLELPRPPR